MELKSFIREIPDFPKPGINFKDITPLLKSPAALQATFDQLAAPFRDQKIDFVAGTESRGFMFGVGVAQALGVGFIPIRKKGKLPAEVFSETYELEYGTDCLEIHKDAIEKDQKVLLVDDLLATGGTMKATAKLVEACGGQVVSCAFLIELSFLGGKEALGDYSIHTLISY
ncbi:adenine phosphoribosyltransferase [Pseudobacteriovorax antillogorgiicola]|uniref:Adenine phosphoribosyltransferase n=1 Tax=Pseudobacteriovorax antillogorgiicola TaxID=1513793 RepID=A0A1Y6BU60_9BACT|nr:adenine phosphoribosyltransferase [Pseudobacteriovorax antillogorgiicola]TCS53917.1 adenine phosphoribosyltransferase [Pseudobacteriovorax antillogorgiicola]SMF20593.1 adenine phosphoribosyltransferase [Pseudobacteriovorax antillogorgiicola]